MAVVSPPTCGGSSDGGEGAVRRGDYDSAMAGENRRVAAQSAAHAQGLADNLSKQGFIVESQAAHAWLLRKKRRRGDHVVTIAIEQPSILQPAPTTSTRSPGDWAPPHA